MDKIKEVFNPGWYWKYKDNGFIFGDEKSQYEFQLEGEQCVNLLRALCYSDPCKEFLRTDSSFIEYIKQLDEEEASPKG